ncbi:MAG TPA: hypothetical protein DCY88_13110 [Cyanobacteria bacterium UBA11372]|nr:hypothetical protein [Cyanobacteria bacterium UBA11372]
MADIMSARLRHPTGGGFISTIRLKLNVLGKTRPYKAINHTSPIGTTGGRVDRHNSLKIKRFGENPPLLELTCFINLLIANIRGICWSNGDF